jgi:hypothetical protein
MKKIEIMYKTATKRKFRFTTKWGELTTEQLWDLKLTDLDTLALQLESDYKESGQKSFLTVKSEKDTTLKLKFDIVLDILNDKKDALDKAAKAKEIREFNKKIYAKIAEAEENSLDGLSVEELKAMVKS